MTRGRFVYSYQLLLILAVAMLGLGCGDSNGDINQVSGQQVGGGGQVLPDGRGTLQIEAVWDVPNTQVRSQFAFFPTSLEYRIYNVATRLLEQQGTLTIEQTLQFVGRRVITVPNLTPGEKIAVVIARNGTQAAWQQFDGITVSANSQVDVSGRTITPTPGEPPASPFANGGGEDGGDQGGDDGGSDAPLATIYTNYGSAGGGSANIGALQVSPLGAFTEVASATASASPAAIEKVGDTVFVALNGINNRIQAYSTDPETGALTLEFETPSGTFGDYTSNIYDLDSKNGSGNLLVALSAFSGRLHVFAIGEDGYTLTEVDSTAVSGATYRHVEYYDTPNNDIDYLYVSGSALSGGEANQILALSLNTEVGELGAVAGSPFANVFRRPGAMDSADGRLFVAETGDQQGEGDAVYWFNINNGTGALSQNANIAALGDAAGPAAIEIVGNLVYVANSSSGDLVKYGIGTSMLVSGEVYPSGLTFPHALLATSVGSQMQLFVAGSSSVKRFNLNTSNGALTTGSNAEVTGLPSPGGLTQ